MTDQMLNSKYKTENLRFLRTHLGMTQKEFIERFLIREDGTPAMSVATFSNLESKGGIRLAEVLLKASRCFADRFHAIFHGPGYLCPENQHPSF